MSALPVLIVLFSGSMKVMKPAPVVQGFAPARSAILMTGYLGGATATNVRVGDPSFVVTVILGILVWLGLYLRDQRLRAFAPLKS